MSKTVNLYQIGEGEQICLISSSFTKNAYSFAISESLMKVIIKQQYMTLFVA